MDNTEKTFTYTYSAAEQTEVENIRKKYLPKEENKMEQLRRLDRSATQKAQTRAITLGTVGVLILGGGMSLVMTELGENLGIHSALALSLGIAAGVVGLLLVALAYPAYNRILQKERRRIAPEVLRLTEELMQ